MDDTLSDVTTGLIRITPNENFVSPLQITIEESVI